MDQEEEEGVSGGCRICGCGSFSSLEVVVVTWQQAQVLKTFVLSSSSNDEMKMMMMEGDLDLDPSSSLPFDFDEDTKKTRLCLDCRSTVQEIVALRQELVQLRVRLRESVERLRSRLRAAEETSGLDSFEGSENVAETTRDEDVKEELCEGFLPDMEWEYEGTGEGEPAEPSFNNNVNKGQSSSSPTLKRSCDSDDPGKYERPFSCDKCFRTYIRRSALRRHLKIGHNVATDKPFKCSEERCVLRGVAFREKKTLESHITRFHPGESESERPIKTGTGRRQRVHPQKDRRKGTFICPTCGKTFGTKASLTYHELRHKPDVPRPFPCDRCKASFKSKRELDVHIRRLHDGANEMCQVCGKLVRYMYAHMMSHIEEADRKYPCPHCPKRFVTRQVLDKHVRLHTGEKPFKCEEPGCRWAFVQPGTLRSHMKSKHDKITRFKEGKLVVLDEN